MGRWQLFWDTDNVKKAAGLRGHSVDGARWGMVLEMVSIS